MESYRSIPHGFFRDADGVILIYSRVDLCSFEGLSYIVQEALTNMERGRTPVWALFGNKCDLLSPIQEDILEERVAGLSQKLIGRDSAALEIHCAVSAKTGENVTRALDNVVAEVHRRNLQLSHVSSLHISEGGENESLMLHDGPPRRIRSKSYLSCCHQ